ncbi:insulinase family protein [Trichothermofontia sichuanensis B231]|uniref:M16 family metallopeptidase n=1 Tax=Trichothermofontia sichuanensis TaxID=3045816 RepID=UPI002247C10C|nr:pitrilysin family protein [Trichothermofontia sichuanensis]UZQ54401.1 insulinase family protein [Trichothermofontia sichuanensis B231]
MPPFPATVCRLDSGLTVIHQPLALPVVVVDVWVKAGAIVEPDEWSGMAHFLEHMIFKGTAQIPPGYFDYVVESCGSVSNAATSHDFAHYYLTTAAPDFTYILPYLAEVLLNAAIPADEFEREREVVLEEIRQADDDPDWVGFQALLQTVYQHHPYRRPVLGTADQLQRYSPQDMQTFHRTYYQPANMTVVVTGDVSEAIALEAVNQSFPSAAGSAAQAAFAQRSQAEMMPPLPPLPTLTPEPPLTGIRRQVLELPRLEQARLLMAWVGPGTDNLIDAYGLDLLATLLSDGRSSRLVRDLREERQLVQDITCHLMLQKESSLFMLSVWLESEALAIVEAEIQRHLTHLATYPPTLEELQRAQRLLCNQHIFSLETPSQLANLYGYYSTIAQPEQAIAYPSYIRAFEREDLQVLAQRYLTGDRYAVTVLKPA